MNIFKNPGSSLLSDPPTSSAAITEPVRILDADVSVMFSLPDVNVEFEATRKGVAHGVCLSPRVEWIAGQPVDNLPCKEVQFFLEPLVLEMGQVKVLVREYRSGNMFFSPVDDGCVVNGAGLRFS
jgi:hypothetical protein